MRDKIFKPDWRVHPSEQIYEMMSERGMDTAAFIRASGLYPIQAYTILKDKGSITGVTEDLVRAFPGTSEDYWRRLQELYDAP